MQQPIMGVPYPRSVEYSRNSENLAEVLRTATQLERMHKMAIRRSAAPEIHMAAQLQFFYLGVEAEALLRKIVSDPTGFNATERGVIRAQRSQIDRWMKAVDLAFRRHYGVLLHAPLDETTLPDPAASHLASINEMLDLDLRPIIENRNKIAHGQLLWQLKSRSEDAFTSASGPLEYGDYWDLHHRSKMLRRIGAIVVTLTTSRPTFERDFTKHVSQFHVAKKAVESNRGGDRYRSFVAGLSAIREPTNDV